MANKKYNEFPEGTYDPDKIFLQADPITGALEKVNLPIIGSASYQPLFVDASNNSYSGSTPPPLYSLTIPANKLSATGSRLICSFYFGIDNTSANYSPDVSFAGTDNFIGYLDLIDTFLVTVQIIKRTSNQAMFIMSTLTTSSVLDATYSNFIFFDPTIEQILELKIIPDDTIEATWDLGSIDFVQAPA